MYAHGITAYMLSVRSADLLSGSPEWLYQALCLRRRSWKSLVLSLEDFCV